MSVLSFVLADNHVLCRLGLEAIIHDQFQNAVIENVLTKAELRKSLALTDDAVVVIDYDALNFVNIDEVVILSKAFPNSKWLFVSETSNETFIIPLVMSLHSVNFIFKANDYDVIASALQATVIGKNYFCSDALQIIKDDNKKRKEVKNRKNQLTATELEIIQLLAIGKTTREIADLRCLSYHTINTHRKNIFRKAEVNSVQELIKYALKNSLVDLTEYYI